MTANLLNTLLSTPESHVTYPLNPQMGDFWASYGLQD